VKRFGAGKQARPVEPVQFALVVLRDGEEEEHIFTAIPRLPAQDIVQAIRIRSQGGTQVLGPMMNTIRKMLSNRDGVPSTWSLVVLPQKKGAAQEPKFRGPDGKLYPLSKAEEFEAVSAGSSRRRWDHLMKDDEDAIVDMKDLADIFEYLVGLASNDRPTQPSA
jgi:hypothetical protein